MDLLPFDEYAASLNRKRAAAGVLFRDERSRVLLLETSYKAEWEIPGGAVEAHEAPWTTALREVREETGIDRPLGRLLVVDYVPEVGAMPEGLAFIFDGGLITEAEVSSLPLGDPEILSAGLYTLDQAIGLVSPVVAGRLAAALYAVEHGGVQICESGSPAAAATD